MQNFIPKGYILQTSNTLEKTPVEWSGLASRIDDNIFYFPEEPVDSVLQSCPSPFTMNSYESLLSKKLPYIAELEFKQIYSYVGDFHVGKEIRLDLGLRGQREKVSYQLKGDLPEGIYFQNGILSGQTNKETGLLRLFMEAKDGNKTHCREFYLRFFKDRVRRPSFVKDHYIHLGFGSSMVEYDKHLPFIRYISPEDLAKPWQDTPFQKAVQLAHYFCDCAESTNLEPLLFASGGIDSQCMIQAFVATKRKFRVIFMRDTAGMNDEDFRYFQEYAKSLAFSYEIFEVNYLDFIAGYKYLPLAFKYRFNNPEYGLLLHLMDQFSGFYVYAGRPCSVNQCMNGNRVLGLAVDETWSKARYLERTGKNGCPEFLSGSLDLLLSFLNRPILSQLDEKKERWYYRHKLELLKQSGFDTAYAPPTKLTGFERGKELMERNNLGDIWIEHRQPLKLFFPNPCCRATNKLDGLGGLGFKAYPDGFSWEYFQKENIGQFH